MNLQQQLKAAKEERSSKLEAVRSFSKKIEEKTWAEATDGPALETAKTALEGAESEVRRIEDLLAIETRAGGWVSDPTQNVAPNYIPQIKPDTEEQKRKDFRLHKAAHDVAYGKPLTGLEAEMMQEATKEMRATGFQMEGNLQIPQFLMYQQPSGIEKRDLTAGTTTTGGYTIQTDVQTLIPFLYPNLAVKDLGATYMTGLTGNLSFPRNDAKATAVWASSENVTSTETTPTFDALSMSPKRVTATTDVSRQMMLQTTIQAENFTRMQLNRAVDILLETAALTGTGSSGQPTGLYTASGTNDITIGTNGGPLTWALTTQFESECAIDDALLSNLGYLTHPAVANLMKNLKRDVAGNGFIWEGPNKGAASVNGYNARTSTLSPSGLTKGSSSSCYGMIFGNWAELMIGQWGGIDIMVNPYTKSKEALVEFTIHAWYDLGIRHAVSFCKCDEITLS